MVSLIIQLSLAWQSYRRIEPISGHMLQLEALQAALSTMEERLANQVPENETLDSQTRQILQLELQQLIDKNRHLAVDTPASLRLAQQNLADAQAHPRQVLLNVLKILRNIFRQEANAHQALTQSVTMAAKSEVELGVIIMAALPLSALVMLYLMRKRIFLPLQQMSFLMELLGNRQYQRVPVNQVDPGFKPILENYNAMVVRLSELESEHLRYQQNLEQQVEQAAGTLIEQQRNLAQSERLAALGEVTARLVHELRNPLAGIKMACINLKNKLYAGDIKQESLERIELVISEIERIIATMSNFLQQSHHEPEPLQDVHIDDAIKDLLALAHFQIPKPIRLEYHGNPDLVCRLPDTGFRQALLNLILNAQQAMGDQPGTITVAVALEENNLVVSVCDQGPGFPEELLNDGIRSFISRRKDGTGLGLAMVNRFARNHEGELEIHNQACGACVKMKLNYIKPKYV